MILVLRNNHREAVAKETLARRAELVELGNAVGRDIARLHQEVGKKLETEGTVAQKAQSELSVEVCKVRARVDEVSDRLDAHHCEFSSHAKAVSEALDSSSSDLIGLAKAVKDHVQEAEQRVEAVRRELDDRFGALESRCNALDSQHHEQGCELRKALGAKGSAGVLEAVQEALDSKADLEAVEAGLGELGKELRAEFEASRFRGRATLENALEMIEERLNEKAAATELGELRAKVTDAMEELDSDNVYVAKKLASVQRALEKKLDKKAASACMHIDTYLKTKGVKLTSASGKRTSSPLRVSASSRAATEDYEDLSPSSLPKSPSSPRVNGTGRRAGFLSPARRAMAKLASP